MSSKREKIRSSAGRLFKRSPRSSQSSKPTDPDALASSGSPEISPATSPRSLSPPDKRDLSPTSPHISPDRIPKNSTSPKKRLTSLSPRARLSKKRPLSPPPALPADVLNATPPARQAPPRPQSPPPKPPGDADQSKFTKSEVSMSAESSPRTSSSSFLGTRRRVDSSARSVSDTAADTELLSSSMTSTSTTTSSSTVPTSPISASFSPTCLESLRPEDEDGVSPLISPKRTPLKNPFKRKPLLRSSKHKGRRRSVSWDGSEAEAQFKVKPVAWARPGAKVGTGNAVQRKDMLGLGRRQSQAAEDSGQSGDGSDGVGMLRARAALLEATDEEAKKTPFDEHSLEEKLRKIATRCGITDVIPSHLFALRSFLDQCHFLVGWIELVLSTKLERPCDLSKVLQDGVILCRLVIALKKANDVPGANIIRKIHQTTDGVFQHIENISNFLTACEAYFPSVLAGLSFEEVDLYSIRRMPLVVNYLITLAQNTKPGNGMSCKSPKSSAVPAEARISPRPAPDQKGKKTSKIGKSSKKKFGKSGGSKAGKSRKGSKGSSKETGGGGSLTEGRLEVGKGEKENADVKLTEAENRKVTREEKETAVRLFLPYLLRLRQGLDVL